MLLLGSYLAVVSSRVPGRSLQAGGLTFVTLAAFLLANRAGMIRAMELFKRRVFSATGRIAVFYLLQLLLGFFGVRFAAVNGSGAIGIGFSVIVVIVAALNLVLDFDFIEQGAAAGAPKYMEWYGAFGMIVTLVWLYLEILLLLTKHNSCR